jgi:hypothetical protein
MEAEADVAMAIRNGLYCSAQQLDKFYTESIAYHLAWIYRQKRREQERRQRHKTLDKNFQAV